MPTVWRYVTYHGTVLRDAAHKLVAVVDASVVEKDAREASVPRVDVIHLQEDMRTLSGMQPTGREEQAGSGSGAQQ